jgi:flagellar biosynthesis/type III secretory pathway protein FliH
MINDQRKNLRIYSLITGLVAGVGFLSGLVSLRGHGKQISKQFAETSQAQQKAVERELKKLSTDLDKLIKQAKSDNLNLSPKVNQQLKELVIKGDKANKLIKEILTDFFDNKPVDYDLAEAIKDAKMALKHINNYLKIYV